MAKTFDTALTTPTQVGKVRDVSNIISNLDKDECPTMTMIGTGRKATNVVTEWEVENLPTYDPDRDVEQGQKAAPTQSGQPDEMSNDQMLFEDSASVTYSAAKQKQYNISDKMAREVRRKSKAMKIGANTRLTGNYGSQKATAANDEVGKFASILAFLTGDNVARGATGADGGYNSGTSVTSAYTEGTARDLTETLFLDTTREIAKGRKMGQYDAICNAEVRTKVSRTFTGVAQLTQEVGSANGDIGLSGSIGFVRHDFGVTRFHYDHTAKDDALIIIQKKLWKMRNLINWSTQDLAKTGLSEEKQVYMSTTLEATNPDGSGAIVDIDIAA